MTSPRTLLEFPILGNPHGAIMESIPSSETIPAAILRVLQTYGDYIPPISRCLVRTDPTQMMVISSRYTFRKTSPGVWDIQLCQLLPKG